MGRELVRKEQGALPEPEREERRIYPAASAPRTTLPDESGVPGGFMVSLRDSCIVGAPHEPPPLPLRPKQADYPGVPVEGPQEPERYRC